jgi:non-ribosomal peptide synthetase component F
VLAVLKAGAGYVPVDLAYPSDRISYMLAEALIAYSVMAVRISPIPYVLINVVSR